MKAGVRVAVATIMGFASAFSAAALKPGDPAPAYRISTFDKQTVTSDQLAGQVVLINFWATWCGPCKAELPAIDAYNRKHAGQGLRVFAVTTEGSIPDYMLRPLQGALSFPLAHRIAGKGLGELGGVPTSFIIDRDGVVRYAKANAFNEDSLDAVIGPLLAQPAHNATVTTASATH